MSETSVLIAGAGPVGLTLAAVLRKQGVAFRVIDKNPHRIEQSRAAVIHARTVEALDWLGLAEAAIREAAVIREASICSPPEREFMRGTFANLESRFPFALGLSQPETERLLEESLAAGERGIVVERGVELLAFRPDSSGVEADLRHPDGAVETVRAQFLAGTDGSRSAVRHGLGLTLEGNTLDVMWLTADIKIDWDRSRERVYQFFGDGGFGFVGPLGADRWRLIVAAEGWTKEDPPGTTLEAVQAACDRLGLDMKLFDPVWISTFSINTRLVPRFRTGRIFLAGDAAHVHSPAGGQGMNTGMQDAFNLGWKLAMVLRGEAGEKLLESYHAERHANARRLLDALGPMSKMVSKHSGVMGTVLPHTVGLLSHVLPIGEKIAGVLSELGVSYPESPVVAESGNFWGNCGPKPGERAAEVLTVRPDGRSLFQLWQGDIRHQLLVFPSADANGLELLAEFAGVPWLKVWLVGAMPGTVLSGAETLDDAGAPMRERYGMKKGGCYLLRPDGHVAFRSTTLDAKPLRDFLRTAYQ